MEEEMLVIKSLDKLAVPIFNSEIKFTNVMEEVLYILLIFYILNGRSMMSKIVSACCRIMNRSHNAIGTALTDLAKLDLISYYRYGSGRIIKLHLPNPFMKSLIFRFFGINMEAFDNHKQFSIENIPGFIPSEENKQKAIDFFLQQNEKPKEESDDLSVWFEWINEIKCFEKAKNSSEKNSKLNHASDLIQQFNNQIISEVKNIESTRTDKINPEELSQIISRLLKKYQRIPPWLDTAVISGVIEPNLASFKEVLDELSKK